MFSSLSASLFRMSQHVIKAGVTEAIPLGMDGMWTAVSGSRGLVRTQRTDYHSLSTPLGSSVLLPVLAFIEKCSVWMLQEQDFTQMISIF